MTKEIIGLVAGGISLISYILYIYAIWWGSTRPSRSSWWILTVVWGVVFLSSLSLAPGATHEAQWVALASRWLQVVYLVGALAIAISTIWRGANEKWGRFDYLCAASAGIALILYFVVGSPVWSFVFGVLADFFGLFPTIKHAYQRPDEEDLLAWVLTCVGAVVTLFAIPFWSRDNASDWIIPVYLTIVDTIPTYFILRYVLKKKPL